MAAKLVALFCLVAAAAASPVAPIVTYAEPEAPAHYQYQYSIHDGASGDVKEQQEAREGDAVHGSYSLVQPDGVHRIVEYTADKEHGFNAVVRYEGTPIEAPAKAAPVSYAAPAKIAYSSPISYAAPAKVAYSSPISYATPAKVAYSSPISYAAPAKIAYSSPISYAAPAKVAYSSPISYAAPAKVAYSSPISYSAPVSHLSYSPVTKVASYQAPLGHVTFSSPAVSYHH